jgi:alpha-beta hydrolase superfamily lysophospholipase
MIGRLAALVACLVLATCAMADLDPPGMAVSLTQRWSPPTSPRALVLALHGFNDSRNAFAEFGAHAAMRGVLVETYDQSGFGARPDRGRWAGADVLTAEARARAAALRAEHPGVPLFVLGESMGGAVAALAFSGPDPGIDGLILSAPAVWGGKSLSGLYRTVLGLANLTVPWLRLTGRGLDIQASDNIEALIALGQDPLYIRATRIDAVAGLVDLMDRASARGPSITVPTLILSGARDQVVPPLAQREFAQSLPTSFCTAIGYIRGWHLLLRDLQRKQVYEDVLAWIEGRRLPSNLDRPCSPTEALPES